VDDVLGNDPPRWWPPRSTPARRVAGLGVIALIGVAVAAMLNFGRSALPPAPTPSAGAGIAGLAIAGASADRATVDRHDPHANSGPWTVTVRRDDGSFGRHGAVVTFPVPDPGSAPSLPVGEAVGAVDGGTVLWPLARRWAQINGDLTRDQLVAIAIRTVIVDGRPRVRAPDGFTVTVTEPYRSPHISETRYGGDLPGVPAFDGMLFVGVARGGGFEDRVYEDYTSSGTAAVPAGRVDGRPAIHSRVPAGNGALAWQLTPGVVAFVGISGAFHDVSEVEGLRRVAELTRVLTPDRWQATKPQQEQQVNDFGAKT
jgi:hypothetical protein